jgi:preprotein translocase subunit SecG
MTGLLLASVLSTLFAIFLILVSVFLILLVLVQRGRGGGLTGALGGMGGQSAFGTKAGDTFTRITIGAATVWIVLSLFAVKLLTPNTGPLGKAADASQTTTRATAPVSPERDSAADAEQTPPAGAQADPAPVGSETAAPPPADSRPAGPSDQTAPSP